MNTQTHTEATPTLNQCFVFVPSYKVQDLVGLPVCISSRIYFLLLVLFLIGFHQSSSIRKVYVDHCIECKKKKREMVKNKVNEITKFKLTLFDFFGWLSVNVLSFNSPPGWFLDFWKYTVEEANIYGINEYRSNLWLRRIKSYHVNDTLGKWKCLMLGRY